MTNIDHLLVSPKKAMYIRFIYENPGHTKTTEIALHFGVDPSTITKTLMELRALGLLSHEPYKRTCLTDKGVRYAEYLVRRHRILGLVLTHYGLSPEDACREAARFENLVSKSVIDSMCRSMGHPTMGVCGRISHDPGCCKEYEISPKTVKSPVLS